jgi:hypothetical protein
MRERYPHGSIQNLVGKPHRRFRFNARKWSWRIYLLRKSAPLVVGLLLLVSVVGLLLRMRS